MTSPMKPGSVVVGVDGSTGGATAVAWAVHYAAARRLPLLVVHGAGELRSGSQLFGPPQTAEMLRKVARGVTDSAVSTVRDIDRTVDVEVSTPLQDPRQALLDHAEGASVLAVGTRGFGAVRILLLGAVSAAVASHASCPVAVVPPTESDTDLSERHVVVGTDVGAASTAALEFAFDLAATEGRALDVLYSWVDPETIIALDSYEQRLQHRDEQDRVLSEYVAGYADKYPDVAVQRHLSDENPARALLHLSRTASTVVVGTRGQTGVHSLLGSVSRQVVEGAHCTVVVVRP